MIKVCSIHGLTEFAVREKVRLRCKKCAVESVQKRREKIKILAVEYKGGKCIKCGYNKYVGALEFHHIIGDKDFNISYKGHCRSWEKVKVELDKCILVCSNCHREIHAGII
jgi:hypothetical protein